MKESITRAAETMVASPKVAQTIATATAGAGAVEVLDIFRSGLSLVAIIVGILLSIVMLVKHYHDYRVAKVRRLEEVLEREEKGLPVRRRTDT